MQAINIKILGFVYTNSIVCTNTSLLPPLHLFHLLFPFISLLSPNFDFFSFFFLHSFYNMKTAVICIILSQEMEFFMNFFNGVHSLCKPPLKAYAAFVCEGIQLRSWFLPMGTLGCKISYMFSCCRCMFDAQ